MRQCPECESKRVIKKGYVKTKGNPQPVPRYKCKACNNNFSSSTTKDTRRQHQPDINEQLFKLICSGVTQRRSAKILGVNKNTIAPKIRMLATRAEKAHRSFLFKTKTFYVQFDEVETFEHTKLKPLSIALAVRYKTGEIISMNVATMNCKGHMAAVSRRIYGPRVDTRKKSCTQVMTDVRKVAKNDITIASDGKKAYPAIVRSVIPNADLVQVLSRRDDTLFRLNHTAAKLRADITRLHRRTWSTTKDKNRLQEHLMLYITWNNRYSLFSKRSSG